MVVSVSSYAHISTPTFDQITWEISDVDNKMKKNEIQKKKNYMKIIGILRATKLSWKNAI